MTTDARKAGGQTSAFEGPSDEATDKFAGLKSDWREDEEGRDSGVLS